VNRIPSEFDGVPLHDAAEYFDPRPDSPIPEVPFDITVVHDTDLMEAFSEQIAWQNHLAVKVAQADIEEAEAEASLKTQEALVMLNSHDDKVTQQRLARDADEEVRKARDHLRVAKARRKLLQVMMENRERAANLISRELTRRVGREGPQRRNDRWTP
jgi:hypothetical protein